MLHNLAKFCVIADPFHGFAWSINADYFIKSSPFVEKKKTVTGGPDAIRRQGMILGWSLWSESPTEVADLQGSFTVDDSCGAQKFLSTLQLRVWKESDVFILKTKMSHLSLFSAPATSLFIITYHIVVVDHTWIRPDCHSSSPALSQITGSRFSPPLTPDAAISVNPFAPRGASLSCGGVSASRESSSFRFHFLSFSFSSSHFFPREWSKPTSQRASRFPFLSFLFAINILSHSPWHERPPVSPLLNERLNLLISHFCQSPLCLPCYGTLESAVDWTELCNNLLKKTFAMIHDSPSNLKESLAGKSSPSTTLLFSLTWVVLTLLFASNPCICIKKQPAFVVTGYWNCCQTEVTFVPVWIPAAERLFTYSYQDGHKSIACWGA